MSRFMTDEEIAAEQELIRQQAAGIMPIDENAEPVSDEQSRAVTPVDLLSSANYTTREIRDERLNICNDCHRLFSLTKTCKECGCFMSMKTWLKNATCALPGDQMKWGAVE